MMKKTFHSNRFGRVLTGLAILVVLVLAACGGGTDSRTHPGATPAMAVNAADGEQVEVALSDFKITATRTSFVVGKPYRFVITNTSKTPHELAIAPPVEKGSAMTSDAMHMGALLHVDADQLPTGTVKTLIYTFTAPAAAGELEFSCHIVGHYDAGMHTPITITQN